MADNSVNGYLSRIESKVDTIAVDQGIIKAEIVRLQTTQHAAVERAKEDRDRLSLLERHQNEMWAEMGKIEDRQKGLTAINGVFTTVVGAIATGVAIILGTQK